MAFQGEYFVDRYGAEAARLTPPIAKMLEMDVPVGAGTDATRVASYDPWVSLYWLTTGKTLGGMPLYGEENVLDRETRSEEHTSELQSIMRISYAVFCLKQKTKPNTNHAVK